MAVVDDKVLERVARLLRLAAPSSNTTLHERESAAVEAAKLIEEHDLVLVRREARREARRSSYTEYEPAPTHYQYSYREEPPRARRVSGDWGLTQTDGHCHCSACSGLISRGDVVWSRVSNGRRQFLHNYSPCYFNAQ